MDPEYAALTTDLPVRHRFVLGAETDPELFGREGTPRFVAGDEAATATINYTSGTTARPKGVQMTHRNLWLNAVTFGWHMGIDDRDTYLHTLPTFHCNGWGLPFAVAGMGARQVVIRKIDGEDILGRIEREGVTFLAGAPAVVAAVLDAATARVQRGEPVPGRGTVRMVVAGAPPPSKVIERVEAELGWEFMQIYGLTETSPLLTVNRVPASTTGSSRPSGPAGSHGPGCRRSASACASTSRARCSPAPTTSSTATGSSPTPPTRRSSTGGSTPATAVSSTVPTS